MKGRILVIRGGAIGDFILTLPVFAALKAAFPQTALEVMGYPHIARLAQLAGTVDAVKPIEARPLAGFFASRGPDLDEGLAEYFASCHVIFSYLYDPDATFRTNLARVTQAQIVQCPHRPDDAASEHAALQLLRPLERLAIFEADSQPRLGLAHQPEEGRVLLGLHPGSGSERKNWPETRWIELLHLLANHTDWHLRLIGGEAEELRLERLAEHFPAERVVVWQGLPLPELARRLASCHRFLGHDSGISHLAASLGLPTLVLWGPTNPVVWQPVGPHVELLHAPTTLADLNHRQVAAALGLAG